MVVVHLPGAPVEAFLLAVVGRGCNERAVRDVWGFKEWFPAAHHSSPRPVKGPSSPRPPPRRPSLLALSTSSFYRLCLHRGPGWIFFGKNFRDVSVSKKNDRPTAADNSLVLPRQNKGSRHGSRLARQKIPVSNGPRCCAHHTEPGLGANRRLGIPCEGSRAPRVA